MGNHQKQLARAKLVGAVLGPVCQIIGIAFGIWFCTTQLSLPLWVDLVGGFLGGMVVGVVLLVLVTGIFALALLVTRTE